MSRTSLPEIRRKSRELLLQTLFQTEFNASMDVRRGLELMQQHFAVDKQIVEYATFLANGLIENKSEIDQKIAALSKNWSMNRLTLVDKNILRIALFELLYSSEVPEKTAINEAIEIAKKYGSTESSQFVNGVLDQAYREKL